MFRYMCLCSFDNLGHCDAPRAGYISYVYDEPVSKRAQVKWDILMKNPKLNYFWLSIACERVVFQECNPVPRKITLSKMT